MEDRREIGLLKIWEEVPRYDSTGILVDYTYTPCGQLVYEPFLGKK